MANTKFEFSTQLIKMMELRKMSITDLSAKSTKTDDCIKKLRTTACNPERKTIEHLCDALDAIALFDNNRWLLLPRTQNTQLQALFI